MDSLVMPSYFSLPVLQSGLSMLKAEISLIVFFVSIVLADLYFKKNKSLIVSWLAIIGVFCSAYFVLDSCPNSEIKFFYDGLKLDATIVVFKILALIVTAIVLMYSSFLSPFDEANQNGNRNEYFSLVLSVLLGTNLLLMANNFMLMYLALELLSISFYILVAFKFNKQSIEAGIKYLIYGATTSAVMLFGISIYYGLMGTLSFYPTTTDSLVPVIILMFFLSSGLFFKLSLFPFHFWVPDTYDGAPTKVVALLSILPKIAVLPVFLAMIKYLGPVMFHTQLIEIFSVVIMITVTIGNIAAIYQNSIKRMLAYSSIAHVGFIAVALVSLQTDIVYAVVYYLLVYSLINMAAFLLLDFSSSKLNIENIDEMKGLATVYPFFAFLWLVIMVAFTGLPPTIGFYAKFFVFAHLLEIYQQSKSIFILILFLTLVLNTIIALFYYLKIPYYLYFKTKENNVSQKLSGTFYLFFGLLVLPLIILFFIPNISSNLINFISR
jgi:NADH-quinone oxidoreductase subunit N